MPRLTAAFHRITPSLNTARPQSRHLSGPSPPTSRFVCEWNIWKMGRFAWTKFPDCRRAALWRCEHHNQDERQTSERSVRRCSLSQPSLIRWMVDGAWVMLLRDALVNRLAWISADLGDHPP